jgi:hypothetical protein
MEIMMEKMGQFEEIIKKHSGEEIHLQNEKPEKKNKYKASKYKIIEEGHQNNEYTEGKVMRFYGFGILAFFQFLRFLALTFLGLSVLAILMMVTFRLSYTGK